jgi:hypothetical protein
VAPRAESGSSIGTQDDFERGAEAGPRGEREPALDALRSRLDVLQSLAGLSRLAVEAGAVVVDRDEALTFTKSDHDLGPACLRVLAHVRDSFLHDPEDLDLLVRRQANGGVDLDVDLERAVGSHELDVAPERRVERRVARGGREGEDRVARLLLRGRGRFLQLRDRRLERSALLEHRGVRRDGEQVLRQPIVNLPRHARPLLGDRTAEDRKADRAPRTDEQEPVGEQSQEVGARHGTRREDGREDVVQRGEQHQRRPECQPAIEILAAFVEPLPEAHERKEVEQRECRQHARQRKRRVGVRIERRQAISGRAEGEPAEEETEQGDDDRVRECT